MREFKVFGILKVDEVTDEYPVDQMVEGIFNDVCMDFEVLEVEEKEGK